MRQIITYIRCDYGRSKQAIKAGLTSEQQCPKVYYLTSSNEQYMIEEGWITTKWAENVGEMHFCPTHTGIR